MPLREGPPPPAPPREGDAVTVSGERARGGDIILRTHAQRWIFIAGLIIAVVLAILARAFLWR